MVIYEVNLVINANIYLQYQSWLKEHVKEMLQQPGFIQAIILKPETQDKLEQKTLTIQYQLDSRQSLDIYLKEFAPKMREQGIKLFNNQFSADRRIFEVEEIIEK